MDKIIIEENGFMYEQTNEVGCISRICIGEIVEGEVVPIEPIVEIPQPTLEEQISALQTALLELTLGGQTL